MFWLWLGFGFFWPKLAFAWPGINWGQSESQTEFPTKSLGPSQANQKPKI
jgi:hypothetical protein